MSFQAAARQVLIDGDHRRLRLGWAEIFPHLAGEGPKTDEDAEIVLHYSRTVSHSIPFKLRAWSHRWLSERSLPSGLPDALKPRAERICPFVVEAVMVGVGLAAMKSPLAPAFVEVRDAMANAAGEAMADGVKDPQSIRRRMEEARVAKRCELFGKGSIHA